MIIKTNTHTFTTLRHKKAWIMKLAAKIPAETKSLFNDYSGHTAVRVVGIIRMRSDVLIPLMLFHKMHSLLCFLVDSVRFVPVTCCFAKQLPCV